MCNSICLQNCTEKYSVFFVNITLFQNLTMLGCQLSVVVTTVGIPLIRYFVQSKITVATGFQSVIFRWQIS